MTEKDRARRDGLIFRAVESIDFTYSRGPELGKKPGEGTSLAPSGRSSAAVAPQIGCSARTIERCRSIRRHAPIKVLDMLRAGKTTMATAYRAALIAKRDASFGKSANSLTDASEALVFFLQNGVPSGNHTILLDSDQTNFLNQIIEVLFSRNLLSAPARAAFLAQKSPGSGASRGAS
ncbi:MAG: hypothetical protein WCG80_06835 [Spirochaetales bacterium]